MPERLGSLADTAPAGAPRMMSGQFDVLDPAIRERFEQEIGFADFGKYFSERTIEGLRLLEKEGLRIKMPDGAVLEPADILERLRRHWPEPGPQSQAPRDLLRAPPGSLAASAPAPPQLKPVPPALSARLHALLQRQPGQELDEAAKIGSGHAAV